jgi:UDP-glucose 4-epimerase
MILITGGLGFIGSHTARALLDLGEPCLLTRNRNSSRPEFIGDDVPVEQVDLLDRSAVLDLGRRHEITGIVHLAALRPGTGAVDEMELNTTALLNILRLARDQEVRRVCVASTIGVYFGTDGPFREESPLPMTGFHSIPAFKKNAEILTDLASSDAGFEGVSLRIGSIWGPRGHDPSLFVTAPNLVHAAVRGEAPPASAYAEDDADLCYAKDCGRAIALVATAERLNHSTYNVGSGIATTNAEVADAIRAVIPDAPVELLPGRTPGPVLDYRLDITRLREDTGFEPAYDVKSGVADYVAWLRAGHDR